MHPLPVLPVWTLSLMPLKTMKGKKQSFVRANVMPSFILHCPKGFSKFTTMEMISFTTLILALTCKSFKFIIESLHKEVSELNSYPKNSTDLSNSVQEPKDGIPQATTTGLSTESVTSRAVQSPATTGF